MNRRRRLLSTLALAVRPVVEGLEDRRLLAADPFAFANTVQPLPYVLDFTKQVNGVFDSTGQSIGFTRVQANANGNQYQPSAINLNTAAGELDLTSIGSSTTGTNFGTNNTLDNALETQFDATTSGFTITARLKGPLSQLASPYESGTLYFGPDDDNYVKLTAEVDAAKGQVLQFTDEQNATVHTVNSYVNIGSFSNITTLDLRLTGDAASGQVSASYALNGGAFTAIPGVVQLAGPEESAFFNSTGRAGIYASAHNNLPPVTVAFSHFEIDPGSTISNRPAIISSAPLNGSTGIPLDTPITADLSLPNGGLAAATVNTSNVLLYRTSDMSPVLAVVNTSGGGDSVVLTPATNLQPNTQYTFSVSSGVQDVNGDPLIPYQTTFTTGTTTSHADPSIAFQKVSLSTAVHAPFTDVNIGPDGKLYASTEDGRIFIYPINADGTLAAPQIVTSLQQANGGKRIITGFAFDPHSTAANPILWVSNSYFGFTNVPDWTGKITVMSGPGLSTVQDAVINLPRSFQDHGTEIPTFGPDGALYFAQGSDTAMGAPDSTWGFRSEHLLTAAVLRLDVTKVTPGTPLNAMTVDAGGPYNPFAAGAPLTIYASGVRNAYSLLWTKDGHLFAPTNGSSAGGNTPAFPNTVNGQRIDTSQPYSGPSVPGLNKVPQSEIDWLFNVQPGKYYGHPNPSRGEYVLDAGNPGSGTDPNIVPQYPVGTQPDANYAGYVFNFGLHRSPDGVIEYQDKTFGGKLQGMLLVSEYSAGDDIVALQRGAGGTITAAMHGISGFTDLNGPLGMVEDNNTGNIYVAELGGANITLLRPVVPAAHLSADHSVLTFNASVPGYTGGGKPSHIDTLTITNTGTTALTFPAGAFTIAKDPADPVDESAQFAIANAANLPSVLQPGQSAQVQLDYLASTSTGIQSAILNIASSDASNPITSIQLHGLGTTGFFGYNEPSLVRVLRANDIPTIVGAGPNDQDINNPTYPEVPDPSSQEVQMQRLVKAGPGPVTITPLASFDNSVQPVLRFGYYTPGSPTDRTELFSINQADAQTVNPTAVGATTFDPGTSPFSLYVNLPAFTDNGHQRIHYSEDVFNTDDPTYHRKFRFFPLEDANKNIVPNAYIVTAEDYNSPQFNSFVNFVGIIRNVMPAADAVGAPVLGLESLDPAPFNDRLVFNRIQIPNPQANDFVHDTDTLRIHNSGDQPLTITGLNLSDTNNWTIVSPTTLPATVPVGGSLDVTIKFIATSVPPHSLNETNDYATQEALSPQNAGGVWNGTLTITSNDPVNPARAVQLAGYWQHHSEYEEEPGLQTLTNLIFGYGTNISNTQQPEYPNSGTNRVLYGEEVYSPYWNAADPTLPVSVRQIDAYHNQVYNGQLTVAQIGWYPKGSGVRTLFIQQQRHSQQLFPTAFNSDTTPAYATMTPSGSFGFYIDGEHSDDALNTTDINTYGRSGHAMRFYPVRDRQGNLVPNEWLLAMDYQNSTFDNSDYQDIVLLIQNVRPAAQPPAPTDVFAAGTPAGVSVQWAAVPYTGAQYNIYSASSAGGPYFKLNGQPLAQPGYLDTSAPGGTSTYYRITAVDPTTGAESEGASASAVSAGALSSPPATPANLVAVPTSSGISLTWNANSEANLAGYNVLRATSASGPFVPLNSTLLTSPSFNDTTAPAGATTYYQVVAVNTSNQASPPATASAARSAGVPTSSIFSPSSAPSASLQNVYDPTIAPTGGVELGLKFRSDTAGYVTGVRYFKGSKNTGPHSGELWSSTGQLLATAVFTNETASGWQQVNFSSPVAITANTTYIVSYQTTSPYLAYTGNVLTTLGIDSPPLHALATGVDGPNAVYQNDAVPGTPVFPATYNGQAPNYWVDVVFTTQNSGPAPSAPTGLTANATTFGQVSLSWSASTGTVTAYHVERSTDGINYTDIAANVQQTSYVDTTAAAGATYIYRVRAEDSGAFSGYSNTSQVTTLPAAPTGLSVTATTANSVSLTWMPSTGATGYDIVRQAPDETSFQQVGTSTGTSFTDSTASGTTYQYEVIAFDATGAGPASSSVSATTLAGTTIFSPTAAPADSSQNIFDSGVAAHGGVELGLKFRSDVAGSITGVRFYKGAMNGGVHSGELWSSSGQLLATATFTNETASGWQQVMFSNPVAIQPNTTYIVSYHDVSGYLSYTGNALAGAGIDNPPLHALATGVDGGNSVYNYDATAGTPAFPSTYNGHASNYWVDVVFAPSSVAAAPSAPGTLTATASSPTQVALAWGASTGTVTAYHVERSTDGVNFTDIAPNVQATSYTDSTANPNTAYTYRVRAENSGLFSGYSNAQQVTTPQATGALTSADIGASQPGSTSVITDGSDYDVTAGGPAIYGTSDGFRYVYEQVSGDFDVAVRINSMTTDGAIDQAGLMARQSLDPSSPNVFVSVSPNGGLRFKYRLASAGQTTTANTTGPGTFPNLWLRLQRTGTTFTGYTSSDGATWTSIGSITLALSDPIFLGLAASANSPTGTITAQFRSFGATQSTGVAPPSAPASLTANAAGSGEIDLAWAAGTGATSYQVQRKGPSDANYVTIAASVAGTSYADKSVQPATTYSYQIVSQNSAGISTTTSPVATATTPAAAPVFTSADINTTTVGSTTVITPGAGYDVTGGGSDIGFLAQDQFRYVYEKFTGNFDAKVQVQSLTPIDPATKAGLMVRATLDAGSPMIFSGASSSKGFRFIDRATANTVGAYTINGTVSYPNAWVRLVRAGNVFTGYYSTDGVNWIQTGSTTLSLPPTLYFGMAVSAHSSTATATAQFRNLSVM